MNTQSPVSKSFIDLLTHTDFMTKCDKKNMQKCKEFYRLINSH